MLSRKAKYAIRALLHLAERRGEGPIMGREIAEKERIPRKFLEGILVELRTAGLIISRAGRTGGYEMVKWPKDIHLGQPVRLVDGPLAPIPCVSQVAYVKCDDCVEESTCVLRWVMKQVRDSTSAILEASNLESMLARKQLLENSGDPHDFEI